MTTYPILNEYYVSVYFELDQYVYIDFSTEHEYFRLYRINKYTGELKPLTQDTSLFTGNSCLSSPFCTLNLSGHYLIISNLLSEMEPEVIDLKE